MLTILLVAYNHESTISASLDSVLGQQTKYPYVVWIAEDCSSDGTLKICKKYTEKYPSKIKLFSQKNNTKGKHFSRILSTIDTKYFAHLDGDDYWCDSRKLQTALNVLERNPKYITFAHDTLYYDNASSTKKSLVHEIHRTIIKNPVDLYRAPYLHASARIHRNIPDMKDHFRKVQNAGDIFMFYYFLDKGPLYYCDKIMSVYNISGKGSWSKLSVAKQTTAGEVAFYNVNKMLGYRHDKFFSQKIKDVSTLTRLKKLLGTRLGWKTYILLLKGQAAGLN